MTQQKNFIIVGQQAWDVEIGSNCKNIALELSKSHRVLYVNPPLDRISKLRGSGDPKITKRVAIISGKTHGLTKVSNNLWTYFPDVLIESINWIRVHKLFVFLNDYNCRLFASSISRAIERLEFTDYILFNDSDIFRSFSLKEYLKPTVSIYYSRDNLIATKYWRRHGVKLEPKLIQKSDLCFANSTFLTDYCRKYNSRSYYIGQGCDLDLFLKTSDRFSQELLEIKSPIVGYVGALTDARLDIKLIEYIARSNPNWTVVLVGPEDQKFIKSRLHKINNVRFLGPKNVECLADYIRGFDVCINPQLVNEFTIGNYPRKIDEYLAVGKPVVAMKTDAMLPFRDYTYLADSKEEFVRMISEALNEDSPALIKHRKDFALSHSWPNSVNLIYKGIDKLLTGKI